MLANVSYHTAFFSGIFALRPFFITIPGLSSTASLLPSSLKNYVCNKISIRSLKLTFF